jgi:hypothetical protein
MGDKRNLRPNRVKREDTAVRAPTKPNDGLESEREKEREREREREEKVRDGEIE